MKDASKGIKVSYLFLSEPFFLLYHTMSYQTHIPSYHNQFNHENHFGAAPMEPDENDRDLRLFIANLGDRFTLNDEQIADLNSVCDVSRVFFASIALYIDVYRLDTQP